MYSFTCWSVAGHPGTSDLLLEAKIRSCSHTPRPEGGKTRPPVWPDYDQTTPVLRPAKPANLRVADRPRLLLRDTNAAIVILRRADSPVLPVEGSRRAPVEAGTSRRAA
jgi:hypothetical protein